MLLSKSKIKFIQSLKEKKYRDKYNMFVAEGDKLVSELLTNTHCNLLIATSDFIIKTEPPLSTIDEMVEVKEEDIDKVSFLKNPQKAIGIFCKTKNNIETNEILESKLSIALDGIQDPGNLGTIIRLADWYGIEHIFCSKDTVDVYNPKVIQATMGAIARVKIHYIELNTFLENLVNIPIYGTFLDGKNMYESKLSDSGIIVMGNEGNGIRPDIARLIQNKLYIPNYPLGKITSESLNVAIATAIICSEFRRLQLK